MSSAIKLIVIVCAVLALDQGSKYLVRANMYLGQSIDIVGSFFGLTYIENAGAAFGILANQTVLFVVLTVIITLMLIVFYFRVNPKNSVTGLALAVVVGGALGNFIDRAGKGTVTDMFNFHFWPVFNVADIALVVGLLYIAFRLIVNGEEF